MIARLKRLLVDGALTRFGPMYHAERLGGAFTLAAIKVPAEDFERVAGIVNGFPEVAHNYQREHAFNMWFVLATERPERVGEVIGDIERATGLKVHNLPKPRGVLRRSEVRGMKVARALAVETPATLDIIDRRLIVETQGGPAIGVAAVPRLGRTRLVWRPRK